LNYYVNTQYFAKARHSRPASIEGRPFEPHLLLEDQAFQRDMAMTSRALVEVVEIDAAAAVPETLQGISHVIPLNPIPSMAIPLHGRWWEQDVSIAHLQQPSAPAGGA
jgi:hypothetical protein